ncbi:uncharacterized protein V1516DRAFT_668349 [Lipomyces oligophaga]|uniref:uncharacterized protein n=1 Tax=Lipomyces oligophaga TaxID=45792 RepID=UPI0034D01541
MSVFVTALTVIFAVAASLNLVGMFSDSALFYGRSIIVLFFLLFWAGFGFLLSLSLAIFKKNPLGQWAAGRLFYYSASALTGLKIIIENEEILSSHGPAIIIANHQSELDVFMLGRLFPKQCSVTAKSSLKYFPFLGWFMLASGCVFIDRGNRGKAVKALDGAIIKMKERQRSVFIFPEGTRSYFSKPELLPFKRGAFHLALQSGFPVIPVVVENYSHLVSAKKRIFKAGTFRLRVLPPVTLEGVTADTLGDAVDKIRVDMLKVLKEISPPVEPEPEPQSSLTPESSTEITSESAALLTPNADSSDESQKSPLLSTPESKTD